MSNAVVIREDDVERETWSDPIRGQLGFRTLFGGDVRTAEFTTGVSELEVGGWFGHHRHEPSEIYYVLSGEGSLSLDGQDHAVRAGTVAYIPGNCEHAIRNTGNDRLRFFSPSPSVWSRRSSTASQLSSSVSREPIEANCSTCGATTDCQAKQPVGALFS